jgi:hypothetical protein
MALQTLNARDRTRDSAKFSVRAGLEFRCDGVVRIEDDLHIGISSSPSPSIPLHVFEFSSAAVRLRHHLGLVAR